MKALILNSGIGSRLKSIKTCKCLVELSGNVSILQMQISALMRCGIEEIFITTGPHAQLLEEHVCRLFPQSQITYINNPLYMETNYIYSMFLAKEHLKSSDVLLLHGDLVFEQNVLQDVLAAESSVMVTDSTKPLPEKDFKAELRDGRIITIGIDVFINAIYAQPMYKLLSSDWNAWMEQIALFCSMGMTNVYAENAFNEISSSVSLLPLDITGRICFEVDNDDDLTSARKSYTNMPDRLQTVYAGYNSRIHIESILEESEAAMPFVVHGIGIDNLQQFFREDAIYFSGFSPNPTIDEARNAARVFKNEGCDIIVSVGGGSAIDTAKCVKDRNPGIQHLAVPTTAGTGSESTSFTVVYEYGVKCSVDKEHLMPDYVILDPFFLGSLPEYHKKSTLLDAMCHAIESLWAKGKTPESMSYARAALRIISEDINGYLSGDKLCAERILYAANLSGRAINIGKTTAAHAMSYMLSTKFGIAHGHAAALCLIPVWKHMIATCNAPEELSDAKLDSFIKLFASFDLLIDLSAYRENEIELLKSLASSVNKERLNNHPVELTESELNGMYIEIFNRSY